MLGLPKDVRNIIGALLTNEDRELLRMVLYKKKPPLNLKLINYAAENGYFILFKWLIANSLMLHSWDVTTCEAAAKNGHLKILKWIKLRGFQMNYRVWAAAKNKGQTEVLNWLTSIKFVYSGGDTVFGWD
jgi:hypothetical protein